MTLVDTSIWVTHLRSGYDPLIELLEQGLAATHPFVLGELACEIPSGEARCSPTSRHGRER